MYWREKMCQATVDAAKWAATLYHKHNPRTFLLESRHQLIATAAIPNSLSSRTRSSVIVLTH